MRAVISEKPRPPGEPHGHALARGRSSRSRHSHSNPGESPSAPCCRLRCSLNDLALGAVVETLTDEIRAVEQQEWVDNQGQVGPLVGHVRRRSLLQELTKLLDGESCVAHDPPERESVDGVVPRNRQDARAVRHDDVLASTGDHDPGLVQSAHGIEVIDAWDARQDQTATSISRISSPRSCSSTTARYSRIASLMFSTASASVAPCDQHPGRPGTETE